MEETLLTPEQVAQRLQVTPRTIYDWLRHGRLRGIKLGRLWRVNVEDLGSFLEAEAAVARSANPRPPRKNEAALRLLEEWMADESGYDEQTWPVVKRVIEENRLSHRKAFDD
jgi:excisionase family DNA binding protein